MNITHWTKLEVTDADGFTLGTLLDAVENCCGIHEIKFSADGSIAEWPQVFVSAPDETPGHNTPRVPVHWDGFQDAVERAITEND